jgi:hypothetical protein
MYRVTRGATPVTGRQRTTDHGTTDQGTMEHLTTDCRSTDYDWDWILHNWK